MNPLNLSDFFDKSVGREGVSVDRLAEICCLSESQIRRWADGTALPRANDLQAIFDSPRIPVWFRKGVADLLLSDTSGMRVELTEVRPKIGCPIRIAFDLDEILLRIQRAVAIYTDDKSEGGRDLTPSEQADIRRLKATFDESSRALDVALKGSTLGKVG